MSLLPNIQYVPQKEIDKAKWNRCLDTASNGLIYGYSFYLDHMANHWDGLVLNDYEAVMPLTWNKKFGIYYLYQPFICAQLGLFGKNITAEILTAFLQAVPKKFRYWDISFNQQNVFSLPGFNLFERVNYVLDLNKSYDELVKGYRENIRRNVARCIHAKCGVIKDFDADRVIHLAVQQMKTYSRQSNENVRRFRELYLFLHEKKQALTYGIVTATNELLASCIFFFSHNRAYYILVGNHPNGKTIGASHALIDAFIKENAGKKLLLDFEGSDIRNLAFFYSSFGAKEEKYSAIRMNRLPFYLKWMKNS